MNINGRDIGFVYTIGVMCTLADYVQANPDVPGIRAVIYTAIEMSKAYCEIHGGEPLTEKEILTLPGSRFTELEETVMAIQKADSEPTVETEPVKDNGKKKDSEEKQN